MRDGKNANYRNDAERETGTPEKVSDVLSTDVSRHVTWTLDSGMGAVSAAFESALDRVVETWGKYRRIWLVRHFDYEDSEEAREYLEKSKKDKSKMNEDELKALNELSKKVRANVDDPFIQKILLWSLRGRPDKTKTSVYLDIEASIATRNKMTYEWVANSGELKDWLVTKRFKITTEKVDDNGEKNFRAFSEIKDILNDWVGNGDGGDGVIFGNRTPSHAFWIRVWRPCYSEKDHTDQMERLGYDFLDIEKATGKPVLIQNGKTLRVTLENLDGVEKAILDACDDAGRKAKISKAFSEFPLIMLQEAANEVIAELEKTDRAQYLAVLRSLCEWKDAKGKHDPELQAYVFERLIENWFPWETLLQWEWSTGALEWMATKGYREMVIRYFWDSEEGPTGDLGPFAKSINVKGMKELFADAYEYWKIRQKQKRSVDPAVRNRWGFYLDRKLNALRQEDGMPVSLDTAEFLKILERQSFFIGGIAGEWKTSWLCEQAKAAILKWIPVGLYSCKDVDPKWLAPGGKIYESWLANPATLFFFDAADEITDAEERQAFVRAVSEMGNRCVTTMRKGTEIPKGATFSSLSKIGRRKYFESKFSSWTVDEMLRTFNLLRMEEKLKDSPIILSLFSALGTAEIDDSDELRNLGIEQIANLDNSYALYENVVKYVVGAHEKFWRKASVTRNRLEKRLSELSKYADELRNGRPKKGQDEDFDEYHWLLAKNEIGEYEFVHQSFYSFFIARSFKTWTEAIKWHNALRSEADNGTAFTFWEESNDDGRAMEFAIEKFSNDKEVLDSLIQCVSATHAWCDGTLASFKMMKKFPEWDFSEIKSRMLENLSNRPIEDLLNFMPKIRDYFRTEGYDGDLDRAIFEKIVSTAERMFKDWSFSSNRLTIQLSDGGFVFRFDIEDEDENGFPSSGHWNSFIKGPLGILVATMVCESKLWTEAVSREMKKEGNDSLRLFAILESVVSRGGKTTWELIDTIEPNEITFFDELLLIHDLETYFLNTFAYGMEILENKSDDPYDSYVYALAIERISLAKEHPKLGEKRRYAMDILEKKLRTYVRRNGIPNIAENEKRARNIRMENRGAINTAVLLSLTNFLDWITAKLYG